MGFGIARPTTVALGHRQGATIMLLVLALTAAAAAAEPPHSAAARAFERENSEAMARMMADMHVPATGDVDVDFVNAMEPHHRGAVAMAMAELRHGKKPQLKRIAQEIIVEQLQEINAMRLAIGRPPLASAPVPTQPADGFGSTPHQGHRAMTAPPK